MVEATVGLRQFLEVTSVSPPTPDLKLPIIQCEQKILELHENNKISISDNNKVYWMRKNENLNKFLDRNFSQIQKIQVLKKIFHGIHTSEREHAIRYLSLLKETKKEPDNKQTS